jgi:predicted TPR repeat methyltransferase
MRRVWKKRCASDSPIAAAAKGLYARLEQAEMLEFLRRRPAQSTDLILAGDDFIYVDDLAPLLETAAAVLAPGGGVAFTVQRLDEAATPLGFALGADLRYAHEAEAIRRWAGKAGLAVHAIEAASARLDGGQPVPGLVVVLEKFSSLS